MASFVFFARGIGGESATLQAVEWEFEHGLTEQGPWQPIGGRTIASSFHDAFAEFRFGSEELPPGYYRARPVDGGVWGKAEMKADGDFHSDDWDHEP
jgi:hypothetical protein